MDPRARALLHAIMQISDAPLVNDVNQIAFLHTTPYPEILCHSSTVSRKKTENRFFAEPIGFQTTRYQVEPKDVVYESQSSLTVCNRVGHGFGIERVCGFASETEVHAVVL